MNTYVMSLRSLYIFNSFSARIHFRRQNLTSEDSSRTGRVNMMWRQDSLLVAWLTQRPEVPGSSPAAADIFPLCTHVVTRTAQICGIKMTTERIINGLIDTSRLMADGTYYDLD